MKGTIEEAIVETREKGKMSEAESLTHLVERFGYQNACIMLRRFERHKAGLLLMKEPYQSHPHKVEPMKGTIQVPPTDAEYKKAFSSFLDQMKSIEEDFMSGKRKIIPKST